MENKKPLISIVILNYNAGDLIYNCINSVFQTKYENYEVILVDNISTLMVVIKNVKKPLIKSN